MVSSSILLYISSVTAVLGKSLLKMEPQESPRKRRAEPQRVVLRRKRQKAVSIRVKLSVYRRIIGYFQSIFPETEYFPSSPSILALSYL